MSDLTIGFGRMEITPRAGVELCGFGPYLLRRSIGVRDPLWARAMAFGLGERRMVLVSCDLVLLPGAMTARVRREVARETGLAPESVLIHSTHTHSGPGVGAFDGYGEPDWTYLEILPSRIAAACIQAVKALQPATLSHAIAPCEGIGLNREYDRDAPPLADVLKEDWRPARPELTDTVCHVLAAHAADGALLGFASYFGCHPVCCCQQTRYVHGDFVGVATNVLEREHPGATGLFLQGAQGDVNSCVVHKPEAESMAALDVIAERYARAVRRGLAEVRPLAVDRLAATSRRVAFTRKSPGREAVAAALADAVAKLHDPAARDSDHETRMAMVRLLGLRKILAELDRGGPLDKVLELQGFRIGPLALLAAPFEVFQAIKNDVRQAALAPIPLVMGCSNDIGGYAVDRTMAARGGYAAEWVPVVHGNLPYADVHGELAAGLLALDAGLAIPG